MQAIIQLSMKNLSFFLFIHLQQEAQGVCSPGEESRN